MTSDKSTSTERGEQAEPQEVRCINHCAHGRPWMINGWCTFRESIDADFCFHRCITEPSTAPVNASRDAPERIRSAAIRKDGVVYVCWAHTYDELKRMNLDFPDDGFKHCEQGFVTSRGRYVDRVEALVIAQAANQIIHKHHPLDKLMSEDTRELPPEPRIEASEVDWADKLAKTISDWIREDGFLTAEGLKIVARIIRTAQPEPAVEAGEVPERAETILRDWAVCILHGLVENSHRCRDYDGEEFGASIHRIKDIVRASRIQAIREALEACTEIDMGDCVEIPIKEWEALRNVINEK